MQQAPEALLTVFDENPKLDALEELIDSILGDPSNKVIVWCKYTAELNLIEERLKKLEAGYVRVDGKTGLKIRGLRPTSSTTTRRHGSTSRRSDGRGHHLEHRKLHDLL